MRLRNEKRRRPVRPKGLVVLALAFALAGCDSAKPMQSTSLPVVSASASGAKVEAPPATTKVRTTTTPPQHVTAGSDGVELKATVQQRNDGVEVNLAITNASQVSVYVTDFALEVKREGTSVRLDRLSVGYVAPDTVILASRLFALEPNVRWVHPPNAYVTKVAPNMTYRSTLHAPIPLRVDGAQLQAPDVECSRIRFELGMIPDSPELTPVAMTIDSKAVYRLSTAAWRLQKVLAVETDLSVPVVTK